MVHPRGSRDEPDGSLAPYFPFVHGGVGAAGRPRRAQGTMVLNLSGEMTRARNPPAARAPSLRMHDFAAGQSSPRLPEALGPGEQTPALFPRTDSSGSFHLGGGRGWLQEATWQHLAGLPTPPRSVPPQTPRTAACREPGRPVSGGGAVRPDSEALSGVHCSASERRARDLLLHFT